MPILNSGKIIEPIDFVAGRNEFGSYTIAKGNETDVPIKAWFEKPSFGAITNSRIEACGSNTFNVFKFREILFRDYCKKIESEGGIYEVTADNYQAVDAMIADLAINKFMEKYSIF